MVIVFRLILTEMYGKDIVEINESFEQRNYLLILMWKVNSSVEVYIEFVI
jgi:hypothetical protein